MNALKKRYGLPLPPKVTRRIDHELAIIFEKNFSAYFLVVEQIVSQASRTCGRGSGAWKRQKKALQTKSEPCRNSKTWTFQIPGRKSWQRPGRWWAAPGIYLSTPAALSSRQSPLTPMSRLKPPPRAFP
ncbi:MAG: hypothetical protein HUN05_02830 [Desulfobacter sp.]|nr:MAG: hypothetical protein HUN05_02830 [Desulfobacter sp.]